MKIVADNGDYDAIVRFLRTAVAVGTVYDDRPEILIILGLSVLSVGHSSDGFLSFLGPRDLIACERECEGLRGSSEAGVDVGGGISQRRYKKK